MKAIEVVRMISEAGHVNGPAESSYVFFDERSVWDMTQSHMPDGEVYVGADRILDFFAEWTAPFEYWTTYALELHEVGETAVVGKWHQEGRTADGLEVEMVFWATYLVEDDKVRRVTVYRTEEEAYAGAREATGAEERFDLRTLQTPIKERYREEPDAARVTLSARGSQSDLPVTCSVDIGRAVYEAQAHGGVGGPGTGACSGDLLLGALAACAQVTCQMVAAAMGIDAQRIEAHVEGDLDLRGTLGVDREAAVGFEAIRLRFEIDAPLATPDELDALLRKTERYCTVMQTLVTPPELAVEMKQTGKVA